MDSPTYQYSKYEIDIFKSTMHSNNLSKQFVFSKQEVRNISKPSLTLLSVKVTAHYNGFFTMTHYVVKINCTGVLI